MRQLIARIDDRLHARLKAQAAAEGRSLNSLVTDALEQMARDADHGRTAVRACASRQGIELLPSRGPASDPSARSRLLESTRGTGPIVDDLLDEDRGPRDGDA